ncbi:Crp/Fnr family transcriptional regulator [Algoriphagus antarcticus]|uniref:Transcriptional regulator /Crp/Fnr family transcriptional regulator n=1 Tax=Algoriphagus antarcticus TaxID=238540 RepID=A0A3E0DHE5_9BACT|nr:Crp/Fnr family transcriptional regulator [Algoriphagus antarcticus]REG81404.1 transcriptional regulator /Crp/Fnr family transcriptional regulator [Algoriphagus antarcticus]
MQFSPYNFLSAHNPEAISKYVNTVEFEKGQLLYQPPQRITPIYEIVKGAICIGTYSPSGLEVCYDILKPGEFFGNLRYLNGQFLEFAKSLSSVIVREYDCDFFKRITVVEPDISEWFNIQVVKRWCRAEDRLYAVRSLDAASKVRKIMVDFQNQVEDASGRLINLQKVITLQDIADLSGLTRQTVSKVLKEEIFA